MRAARGVDSICTLLIVGRESDMRQYPILVVDAGGGFLGRAVGLPGCMSDGDTPEEALANTVAAAAEWLDEARVLGRTVPEPISQRVITVRASWDDDADVWIAESPDLPGLLTEAPTLDALDAKLPGIIQDLL
jgi:predicted RNase H-like HicB family nuclease